MWKLSDTLLDYCTFVRGLKWLRYTVTFFTGLYDFPPNYTLCEMSKTLGWNIQYSIIIMIITMCQLLAIEIIFYLKLGEKLQNAMEF